MKSHDPPPSPRAREAALIEHIVELIRSAAVPEGDQAITNDVDPFEGDPEFETPKPLRGTTIASSEIVTYGSTAAAAVVVRSTANFLQEIFAINDDKSPWGSKKDNRDDIAEVARHLEGLRRAMEKLPPGVCYLLYSTFTPELSRLSSRSSMEDVRKVMTRFAGFNARLRALHHRCEELSKTPPGERANTAYREKLVAGCAADLLDCHGIKPTRGNEDKRSLFEQVAESLFELATGERCANLKHACREVLNDWETQGYLLNDPNESEGLS
jgi:hypothetical protein